MVLQPGRVSVFVLFEHLDLLNIKADISSASKFMLKEDLKKMPKKKLVGLILLAILAIFLWQVSIPAIMVWLIFKKAPTKTLNKWLLSILLVFIYMGIFGTITHKDDNNKQANNSLDKEVVVNKVEDSETIKANAESQKQAKEEAFKAKIEKDISDLKNYKALGRDSVVAITAEIGLFSVYAEDINMAKRNYNEDIKKLGTDAEALLKKVQVREFPAIRKQYVEVIKGKLWENNVDVSAVGTGNSSLLLVGGIFANNKNIMEMHGNIQAMTELLRFKKVGYKWYSGSDESYYTNDKAKADNQL